MASVRRALLALAALAVPLFVAPAPAAAGGGGDGYVLTRPTPGGFPLAERGRVAPLVVSAADHAGVQRVAGDLRADLAAVTGARPELTHDTLPAGRDPVIIGTLGRSPLVDRIVAAGKLDVRGVAGRWETSLQQVAGTPCRAAPPPMTWRRRPRPGSPRTRR